MATRFQSIHRRRPTYARWSVHSGNRLASQSWSQLNQIAAVTDPKGLASQYTRDALGQPKAWAWSNGATASRTFDADGRMTSDEFASYTYDSVGRIAGITQNLDAALCSANSQTGTQSTVNITTPLHFSASYDNRNRLTA